MASHGMTVRSVKSRYFPHLNSYPTPGWLRELENLEQRLPIANVLQGSVFYPASGTDDSPVKYLRGLSHSFVYADWRITQDELTTHLRTLFDGYRCTHTRSVTAAELCIASFQSLLPVRDYGNPWNGVAKPYAVWAIYDRDRGNGKEAGPERFSLLCVGGEGLATFRSLYLTNHCTPSVVTLIRCGTGGFSGGNRTDFVDSHLEFACSVMQNPHGTPEYLFTYYGGNDDGHGPESPWPSYSKLHGIVNVRLWGPPQPAEPLWLWGRGSKESVTQ